jgi:transcriptional regulator with XRE-family HTH domain
MKVETVLGTRISELLEQRGISQRELADRVGVTEVSMSRYINGGRTPKAPILANIAKELHTTSAYLLGHDTGDTDPELEYYQTQRAIARNANKWTKKQKADLVNALFESE